MKYLQIVAAVFMVFAAAGLSVDTDNDPCSHYPTDMESPGSSSAYQWWPPGVTCTYSTPDGQPLVTKQDGHPVAFVAILAAGLLLVLGRRSKLALATALVFGVAGLAGFFVGFVPIPFVAFCVGLPLALLATRSLLATSIAFAALMVGWFFQFFGEIPAIYVILLLIIAMVSQRAEVVIWKPISH